ncbi:MAG: phosphate signaling complex protein PhoU [Polyangiaceae bacterium]|nr:phosphate signaling complex protein PhoU [Polyangiaceae bacterium]
MSSQAERAQDRDFRELRERLLLMAGRVELMIADSVRALIDRDVELAKRTIDADRLVNSAEVEIDELCMLILVRRSPVARDLRFVTVALKMVTDLERMGDLAVSLAERTIDLSAFPQTHHHDDIAKMAGLAQRMLRDVMDAFAHGSAEEAERVMLSDDELDEAYHDMFRGLLKAMIREPSNIEAFAGLQSMAKHIERIGDHATNLAELVILNVRATDVRHHGKLGVP